MSIEELKSSADDVPSRIGIEVSGTTGGASRPDGWYADDRWIAVTAAPHVYHVVRIGEDGIVLGDPAFVQERFFSWERFDAMWTRQAVLVRRDLLWTQTLSESAFAIEGLFLELFRSEGGLAAFGLPLGPAYEENGRHVQRFERAVMETHPEAAIPRILGNARGASDLRAAYRRPTPDERGGSVQWFEARELLVAMGIAKVVVDYQERAELGDLFEQVAPYTVVSHHPAAGAPVTTSDVVILGVRAP